MKQEEEAHVDVEMSINDTFDAAYEWLVKD
jgi:hypothetical protein